MAKPNELYAVDPQSIESIEDFFVLLKLFGIYQARFIAVVPGKWKQNVIKRISELYEQSPDQRAANVNKVMKKLGRLPDRDLKIEQLRSIPIPYYPKSGSDNIYVSALNDKIVDKCITLDGGNGAISFKAYKVEEYELELFNYDKIRDVDDGVSIIRQISILMPMIEFNDEITIIDPYMDLTKKNYKNLIYEIIKKLESQITNTTESKTLNLYFSTRDNKDREVLRITESMLENVVEDMRCVISTENMKVKLYPMVPFQQDLHDRWVLGNLAGGWNASRGSRAQNRKEELTYTAIAKKQIESTLKDYALSTNRIKLDFNLSEPLDISKT